jgi:ribosomal protein S18 acetylase RimI-like enzyme
MLGSNGSHSTLSGLGYSKMGIEVSAAETSRDLNDIVHVHMQAFPQFFMTLMGSAFVREYYLAALEYRESISFVAREGNRLIGFVTGFGNPRNFYAYYRSRRWRLVPSVIAALILKPGLFPRILRNVKRVSSEGGTDSEVELSSIGVLGEWAGTGVGRLLLASFTEAARSQGFRSIYLTTDAHGNDRVNRFYLKRGFELESSFLQGPRTMNKLRLLL